MLIFVDRPFQRSWEWKGNKSTRAALDGHLWYVVRVAHLVMFAQFAEDNIAVMSVGFMLPNPGDAIIWRGPKKK